MESVYIKEIFEYPISEFKQHLELSLNERIIFSGKYGVGKTKFLENFFEEENQISVFGSKKYNVFRLFPINYSIASNEDILRYIKYDIIIDMLKNEISIEEIKLDLVHTLPFYAKKNIHKITAALIYMIPKLGKEVVDCFEKIDKLKEEYLKYHDNLNKSSGDKLVEYLELLEMKEGSVYESDITTKIISEGIKKNENVQSVLLIDDVDRLDPEHVFRIMNVFAAHFESNSISGMKNKFNFDKIIIVCDFNNIRNLFHHRYGSEVDFMGYIDKFYSSDVYCFDNKKAIFKMLDKIFDSIQYLLRNDTAYNIRQLYFNNDFIKRIAILLMERNVISLRNLLKLSNKIIPYHFEEIAFKQHTEIVSHLIPVAMQLKLIRDILGDYKNMCKAFEQCLKNQEYVEDFDHFFGLLMYILTSDIHDFSIRGNQADIDFEFLGKRMLIQADLHFTTGRLNNINIFEYKENSTGLAERGFRLEISVSMFWQAMLDVIKKLNQLGFLY